MLKLWDNFFGLPLHSWSSPLSKTPPPPASLTPNSFFPSDHSAYSSVFSLDGPCSSSPCLNTTFPQRLYTSCLLTLHSLWGSPHAFLPTAAESRIYFLAGVWSMGPSSTCPKLIQAFSPIPCAVCIPLLGRCYPFPNTKRWGLSETSFFPLP